MTHQPQNQKLQKREKQKMKKISLILMLCSLTLSLEAQGQKNKARFFNSPFGLALESFIPTDTVDKVLATVKHDSAYELKNFAGFYLVYRAGTDTLLISVSKVKYPASPYDDEKIWEYRVLSRDMVQAQIFFKRFEFRNRFDKPWLRK
ncbi:MAG: hypothetical protein HY974_03015 [Candidatus Kerfeldbacteria bacterium]|nr:hypothetical protein [Candidatus Kerfeldbacteria bacterium]